LKEEKLYFEKETEDFSGNIRAGKIIKEVRFSDNPRDIKYVSENIPCQKACPANTNIPGYIRCISENRFGRSFELNRMYNIFPGVLGRICSRPCEEKCRHGEGDLGKPVNICWLKRAGADLKSPWHRNKENLYASTGKTVAVIGAGPAGLSAAHELATHGHKVTIYEAMENPGGMLMYGIPEFRLPRTIVEQEIDNIVRLGIDIKQGVEIGIDIKLKELLKQYNAVIATTGCPSAFNMNIPGEELDGVFSGFDFVKNINSGSSPDIGNKVVVIGGGYTAIDCARLAIRLGAQTVSVNLRKTEEFMRIDEHEMAQAKNEKIRIYSLVQPVRIEGKSGSVKEIVFERTRLETDKSGKGRISVPIENSGFAVDADTVIIAIGQHPDAGFAGSGIKLDGQRINTKQGTYKTNIKGLYAAGDCVTGATNVISAIARGREVAQEIDELFVKGKRKKKVVRFEPSDTTDRKRSYDFIPQVKMPTLSLRDRMQNESNEVELGYDKEAAHKEAKRCYLCYYKYEIDTSSCIYCSACIDVAPRDCIKMINEVELNKDGTLGDYIETSDWQKIAAIAIDNKRCIRCGKCYEVCPMDCIHITKVELIEQNLEA
jgi:glutamate synthase (NADPH) small chain